MFLEENAPTSDFCRSPGAWVHRGGAIADKDVKLMVRVDIRLCLVDQLHLLVQCCLSQQSSLDFSIIDNPRNWRLTSKLRKNNNLSTAVEDVGRVESAQACVMGEVTSGQHLKGRRRKEGHSRDTKRETLLIPSSHCLFGAAFERASAKCKAWFGCLAPARALTDTKADNYSAIKLFAAAAGTLLRCSHLSSFSNPKEMEAPYMWRERERVEKVFCVLYRKNAGNWCYKLHSFGIWRSWEMWPQRDGWNNQECM